MGSIQPGLAEDGTVLVEPEQDPGVSSCLVRGSQC